MQTDWQYCLDVRLSVHRSLSCPLSLPPLWHTWQQQRGQAVFPADKYSDTPCLTGRVHQARIGMDRLCVCVCVWVCMCVCVFGFACLWQPGRLHGARAAFWIGLRRSLRPEPSRVCVTRPLLFPPSFLPLTPPPLQHPMPTTLCSLLISSPRGGGLGAASCQPGNADMHRLASLHLEQSPLSALLSPPSLFLLSFPSPFLCCLNYTSSQSRK